jgi:Flp pilus assembly protein TadG
MTRRLGNRRKGSTAMEFVLVGIPLTFLLFSVFEGARGMWNYQMIAYAVREGTRYAAMHGRGCASPNTCQVTIGQIASYVQTAGSGVDPGSTLTLTPASGSATSDTITNLKTNTTKWPPSSSNVPGQTVTLSIKWQFKTFLSILWAGASNFDTFYLTASSAEPVQF